MRFRTSTVLILLCAFATISSGCKKPIGIAYVIKDAPPVYSDPSDAGAPLGRLAVGATVTILGSQVADVKLKNRFWYEIESGPLRGYLSYEEEVDRRNVISFHSTESGSQGMILASSLRMRERPGLDSKVLKAIPRGTIVDVLQIGSIVQNIDGKSDTWLQVRTKEGQVGYSYAGYIQRGTDFAPGWSELKNMEPIEGFVCFTVDQPVAYADPVKKDVLSVDEFYPTSKKYACGEGKNRAQIGNKVFYRVLKQQCGISDCIHGEVEFWVGAGEVELVSDLFQYQMEHFTPPAYHKMLTELAASQPPKDGESSADNLLLPATARIEPIHLGSTRPGAEHFIIHIQTNFIFPHAKSAFVVEKNRDEYAVLGEFDAAEFTEYEGKHYLISNSHVRITVSYSVHEFTGSDFHELIKMSVIEGTDIEFEPPYLTVQWESVDYVEWGGKLPAPFDPRFKGKTLRVLKLENGKFQEIDPASRK